MVEFDDVMNDQRKVIYEQRADIMDAESVGDVITDMRAETARRVLAVNCPPGTYPEQWNIDNLKESIEAVFGMQAPVDEWLREGSVDPEMMRERLQQLAASRWRRSWKALRRSGGQIEKQILIQTLDHHWKDHLATLDALRQVIHLRSYAQKKPIDEYKQEAFLLFERLLVSIREEVTRILMRAQVQLEPAPPPLLPDFVTQHIDPFSGDDDTADIDASTGAVLRAFRSRASRNSRFQADPMGRSQRRRSAVTHHARAARARSTSIATGSSRSAAAVPPIDRTELRCAYRPHEEQVAKERIEQARLSPEQLSEARVTARALVKGVRAQKPSGVDAFLHAYDLGSDEGIAMMCLAEALLRIPDAHTADELIADKLAGPNWSEKLGHSDSAFVNAATFSLLLTGKVLEGAQDRSDNWKAALGRAVGRLGEPVVRAAVREAMKILGRNFVFGRTIDEALRRAAPEQRRGLSHSFDMLGEAAKTYEDAERYAEAYRGALNRIAKEAKGGFGKSPGFRSS